MKTVIALLTGAALATSFILACSDDSPSDADAAICDCPASEPPIPTRLMTVEGPADQAAAGPSTVLAIALCPAGAKVISGGCFVDEGSANDITITGFGKLELGGQEGHECRWFNNFAQPQMVHAEATCLVPAQ